MYLLNCTACDDILRIGDKVRRCECGRCGAWQGMKMPDASFTRLQPPGAAPNEALWLTGAWRVIRIPWEEYDGAAQGSRRSWSVFAERPKADE